MAEVISMEVLTGRWQSPVQLWYETHFIGRRLMSVWEKEVWNESIHSPLKSMLFVDHWNGRMSNCLKLLVCKGQSSQFPRHSQVSHSFSQQTREQLCSVSVFELSMNTCQRVCECVCHNCLAMWRASLKQPFTFDILSFTFCFSSPRGQVVLIRVWKVSNSAKDRSQQESVHYWEAEERGKPLGVCTLQESRCVVMGGRVAGC